MSRFRPTRAGIINLWDYSRQELAFREGWLVLRGANGSGKTKALEVLFPFVFDGRMDPRRLDPFSGRQRTMRDNLLYRGDDSMLGYAWLELSRPRDAGVDTVTVGVGMRAQRAHSRVESWFFVTDRGPIGQGWDVLDEEGRPRTRASLAEVLGSEQVRERAEDHRRAVDAALFGLGAERYEGMLRLVLDLRRPQLAKDLDPDGLEKILRDGLRPIDPELVARAARAFDDLEAGQREVQQLQDADELVQKAAEQHRRYLRTMAAERARSAAGAEERAALARGVLARDRAKEEAAREAEEGARRGLAVLDVALADQQADLRASKESEAYRAAGTLDDKRRLVDAHRGARDQASEQREAAAADHQQAVDRHEAARERLRERQARVRQALERLGEDAREAGVDALSGEDLDHAQRATRARIEQRRAELSRTRRAVEAWGKAEETRDRASQQRADAEAAVEDAGWGAEAARDRTAQLRERLLADLAEWWQAWGAGLLEDGDRQALVDAGHADDPVDLGPILQARLAERRDRVLGQEGDLRHAVARRAEEAAGLREERARVAAQQEDAPPAPPRRDSPREGRAGAPLWRLVRFREGVAEGDRAAVEAALEAAGLLDAWIHPRDEGTDDLDSFLAPGPATEPHLGTLLEPETDFGGPAPVPAARIRAVLASIGLADQAASVRPDGRFRLSLLSGTAAAEAARYIGASTRAARRRRRLAELDARLQELGEQRRELEARLRALAQRRAAWDQATGALPAVVPIRRARDAELAATSVLTERRRAAQRAAEALDRAIQAERQAHRALLKVAADCRLPHDPAGLARVEAAVARYDRAAQALVLAVGERRAAAAAEQDAASAVDATRARVESRAAALTAADQRLAEVERELATLEATLGAEAREVLQRIEAIEEALRETRRRRTQAAAELDRAMAERGEAEKSTVRSEERLVSCRRDLDTALDAVAALADGALAEAIGVEPALARAAAAALETGTETEPALLALVHGLDQATADLSPTDDRLKAAQTQVDNAYVGLVQGLPPSLGRVSRQDVGGIVRLTVHDAATDLSLGAFARNLARRVAQQAELLSVRERQLLEDTLLAGLATEIQDRTHTARQLVREMDQELRQRRLSSGQTVGITWTVDDRLDRAERQALDLLARDPALIGADGLARLRTHFAERIKARRAEQVDQSYRDLLGHVLDYRRWYRLRLYLYDADGTRQPLTPARHARLSGGEKAATLHLPLFAAALARFSGGRPDCPRLVALDEAFAGIDDVGRPELLGLAAAFGLDLFMTGYDLWAVGAQVPAAAHYELIHLRDAHEVVALQVDWQHHG